MYRRAFTLIELLVVIAIIAILAAILFPVFAQAKLAAKGAASISNINQNGKAWLMYAQDYDDRAVPVWALTPGPLEMADTPPGTPYSPWSQLVQPYTKNSPITQDPLTRSNTTTAQEGVIPNNLLWPYRPQYGYAFTVWSPLTDYRPLDGSPRPIKLTETAAPADTIVFTARKDRLTLDWRVPNSIIWMAQSVAPPFCAGNSTGTNPDGMCALNMRWGIGGLNSLNPYPSDMEGGRTGGVAIRKARQTTVMFGDGSTKFVSPGFLAQGTNWNWDIRPGQIRMTDVNLYRWDID